MARQWRSECQEESNDYASLERLQDVVERRNYKKYTREVISTDMSLISHKNRGEEKTNHSVD